ncbi:glycosyltransferase [Streptococcus uberis]|uniref:glycosyltransferase n=1 Tax=Streptococcus uberis TaxID=1349 RepID=UPI0021F18915|nr:glycosyltransferase [Streptococcus uberis]MCV6815192.1 glycosyltransferase [Streptococcus uberis]MCZ8476189.1 glycosyltransferase [Streptococcus uberis]
MKNITIIYTGYLPGTNYGGPVSSIFNFTELFGKTYNINIICKNHDLNDKKPYQNINDSWNTVGKAKVLYLPDEDYNQRKIINILNKNKPDFIYLSSIMSPKVNLPIIKWANLNDIKVVLAPRGELNKDALSKKSLKKSIYLKALNSSRILKDTLIQATSNEEYKDIISNLKVKKSNVVMVPNVPPSGYPKLNTDKQKNELKILSISRIVRNKNILESIKLVKKLKSAVIFDIYGPIEDKEYWNECLKEMMYLPNNIKINYFGVLNLLEARKVYSKYDVLMSLTEFENYGQVIAEALINNCPVVISKGTTPWDDVNSAKCGFAIPLHDKEKQVEILTKIAEMDNDNYKLLVDNTKSYISKKIKINEISDEYHKLFFKREK